jgi:accessory gene regulator B
MRSLTDEITDILIESGAVSENERHIYRYCVEGLVEMGGNIMLTMIIGLLAGKLLETAIFLSIIIPLRSTAGGFHAESGKACFVISLSIYIITVFSAEIIGNSLEPAYNWLIYAVCASLILIIAPVDCKNKPLSEQDKRLNKNKCVILMTLISVGFIIVWILNARTICFLISACLITVTVLLLLGVVKNRHNCRSVALNDRSDIF